MSEELWQRVDQYLADHLGCSDPVLDAAQKASREAGLPAIAVTPTEGKFLHILARMIHARRILEIGALGGYSAIWLARALAPGGRLITLEAEPRHAAVAAQNIARAGLQDRVEIRIGKALDTLATMSNDAPFDFVFIDADKPSNPDYFQWAMKLTRPGSVIVIDNVIRKGAVADAASTDESVVGTRRMFELIAAEKRVTFSALQTLRSKGHDGFAVGLVVAGQ